MQRIDNRKLASLGDDAARRWVFIVSTLRKLKNGNKLDPAFQEWLPEAEKQAAQLNPS